MKKVLLIIDAQYDFINGNLEVNGSEEKMIALSEYIGEHGNEYDKIILTADWHPINHCSFDTDGGSWPIHCVQYTQGAEIYKPILNASNDVLGKDNVIILTKGDNSSIEEYSIFVNEKNGKKLIELLSDGQYDSIDICGIAGDFCVHDTINDLCKMNYNDKLMVLTPFIKSIDDGSKLRELIEKEELKFI